MPYGQHALPLPKVINVVFLVWLCYGNWFGSSCSQNFMKPKVYTFDCSLTKISCDWKMIHYSQTKLLHLFMTSISSHSLFSSCISLRFIYCAVAGVTEQQQERPLQYFKLLNTKSMPGVPFFGAVAVS